jgi:hypothetical protein
MPPDELAQCKTTFDERLWNTDFPKWVKFYRFRHGTDAEGETVLVVELGVDPRSPALKDGKALSEVSSKVRDVFADTDIFPYVRFVSATARSK